MKKKSLNISDDNNSIGKENKDVTLSAPNNPMESIVSASPLIKSPGDKITEEMKPHGNIITRVDTKEFKAVGRQYTKKDGTPGKKTITFMELDDNK